jgi:hypothetical protein
VWRSGTKKKTINKNEKKRKKNYIKKVSARMAFWYQTSEPHSVGGCHGGRGGREPQRSRGGYDADKRGEHGGGERRQEGRRERASKRERERERERER